MFVSCFVRNALFVLYDVMMSRHRSTGLASSTSTSDIILGLDECRGQSRFTERRRSRVLGSCLVNGPGGGRLNALSAVVAVSQL